MSRSGLTEGSAGEGVTGGGVAAEAQHQDRRGAAAPSGGRLRRFLRNEAVVSVLLGVVLLVATEFASRRELVSELILPSPTGVAEALADGIRSGIYVEHIISTLAATVAGFLIAAFLALAIAAFLTTFPYCQRVLLPYIVAFQTLPKIAVAPLAVLWLGFGASSKLAIVGIVCFFPILINSVQGMRIRDRDLYDLFSSLGASKWQMVRHLRLPSALPYVFAGLHIGAVFALIGAVVAEFVGAHSGLGVLLIQQRATFNLPGVFAVLFILMVVGLTVHLAMVALERRVTFWAKDVSTEIG